MEFSKVKGFTHWTIGIYNELNADQLMVRSNSMFRVLFLDLDRKEVLEPTLDLLERIHHGMNHVLETKKGYHVLNLEIMAWEEYSRVCEEIKESGYCDVDYKFEDACLRVFPKFPIIAGSEVVQKPRYLFSRGEDVDAISLPHLLAFNRHVGLPLKVHAGAYFMKGVIRYATYYTHG